MILTQCLYNAAALAVAAMGTNAGLAPVASEAETGGGVARPPDPLQAAVPAFPDLPVVRLALMPGFDDEAAYLRSIAARADELAARADRVDDLTKRTELQLAAANLILAHQIEPPCTGRLLYLAGRQPDFDQAPCRKALDQADRLLKRADSTLQATTARGDSPPEGWFTQARQRLQTLQAFASGLRAYLIPGEGEKARREVRRAASLLAPLLEDRRPPVAAAANLWQACLRSRESDPGRALSLLDPVLLDPPQEHMPYALFARLLRCRLLAEHGGSATALALLMQIEERCNDWLTGDTERDNAVRAAQFIRIQIMADWYDRLAETDEDIERRWCAERAASLIAKHFGGNNNTILRLTPVIPIVATPPRSDAPVRDASPEGS